MTDMNELKNICNKYKIFLIEDCAEAIGSYYRNKHAGNFGSIATFSFYGNKQFLLVKVEWCVQTTKL